MNNGWDYRLRHSSKQPIAAYSIQYVTPFNQNGNCVGSSRSAPRASSAESAIGSESEATGQGNELKRIKFPLLATLRLRTFEFDFTTSCSLCPTVT
jgi:hypothetical protein